MISLKHSGAPELCRSYSHNRMWLESGLRLLLSFLSVVNFHLKASLLQWLQALKGRSLMTTLGHTEEVGSKGWWLVLWRCQCLCLGSWILFFLLQLLQFRNAVIFCAMMLSWNGYGDPWTVFPISYPVSYIWSVLHVIHLQMSECSPSSGTFIPWPYADDLVPGNF